MRGRPGTEQDDHDADGLIVFLNGTSGRGTSTATPLDRARRIARFLPARPAPTAFQRLRHQYGI
ncbi:hypothetical protein ACWEV4_07305 [Streptomyces sp. NPDC003860]